MSKLIEKSALEPCSACDGLRPNGAPPLTLQGLTIGGTAYGKPQTMGFWAAAPQPPQRLACVGEVL